MLARVSEIEPSANAPGMQPGNSLPPPAPPIARPSSTPTSPAEKHATGNISAALFQFHWRLKKMRKDRVVNSGSSVRRFTLLLAIGRAT